MDKERNETLVVDNDFKDVETKKSSSIILGIVLILLVGICVVGGYFGYKLYYMSKPSNVFESTINNSVKKVNDALEEAKGYSKANLLINAEFTGLMFEIMGLNSINDYEFSVDALVDQDNKDMSVGFVIEDTKSKHKGETYIYYKDGKAFLDLKDAYKDIIELELSEEEIKETEDALEGNTETITNEELSYLIGKISDLVVSSFDEEHFTKEKTEVEIKNSKYSVTANKYVFTPEKQKSTLKTVIDGILNDSKSLEYMAKLGEVTVDEMKSILEDTLENINFDEQEDFTVIIYVKGITSDVIGFSIVDSENVSLDYYSIEDNYYIELDEAFKVNGSSLVNSESEVYLFDEESNNYKLFLTYKIKNSTEDLLDVDFEFANIDSEEVQLKLNGNVLLSSTVSGTTTSESIIFTLNMDVEGEVSTMKVSMKAESDSAPASVNVDVTNAKKMSEVDETKLEEALINHYSKFELINSLLNSEEAV